MITILLFSSISESSNSLIILLAVHELIVPCTWYGFNKYCCCCSVMSGSLGPHGLHHTSLPCPPLSPGVWSNSCPLSRWCSLIISFSATLFSFCLPSYPTSESFPMSLLFTSGGQSIGASASASVFPMNIQDRFPLGLTGLISLQSRGISRHFLTPQFKSINSLALSLLYGSTLTTVHDYWKNHSFD